MKKFLDFLFLRPPEPEPEYEYLLIPQEHGCKFAKLVDASLAPGAGRLHRYNLWSLIESIYPETVGGGWSIVWLRHSQPALCRVKLSVGPTSPTYEPHSESHQVGPVLAP